MERLPSLCGRDVVREAIELFRECASPEEKRRRLRYFCIRNIASGLEC
jgi:hypothetical protein